MAWGLSCGETQDERFKEGDGMASPLSAVIVERERAFVSEKI